MNIRKLIQFYIHSFCLNFLPFSSNFSGLKITMQRTLHTRKPWKVFKKLYLCGKLVKFNNIYTNCSTFVYRYLSNLWMDLCTDILPINTFNTMVKWIKTILEIQLDNALKYQILQR